MNVLVEDLNKLQTDGITISCFSSRIYFVFSSVCGDNLASNEVGDFQKSFSSGSFCRHCFIIYEQKHIPLTDISFVPRTRLKHDMILNQVVLNNGRQIIQGIKGHNRVKFVDQRTKLILNFNEQRADKHAATVDVSNSTSPLVQPYDELEKNDIPNSFDANENIETNSRASTTDPDSSSNFPLNHDADIHSKAILPDDYEGPNLTIRMEEYIEQNHISKFNPHTKMRRELLSSIFDDVTKSHQLL
ncbi:unnamed protein product [Rotaria sp. Silwood2]|nr:unnamed protein product [Rotaria sp. Silwood2]